MKFMLSFLALAIFAVSPAYAQIDYTDCWIDELTGPAEKVEHQLAQYRQTGNEWVQRDPKTWRRVIYDAECFMVRDERIFSDATHVATYRSEGHPHARRGSSETIRTSDAPPPLTSSGAGKSASDDYRRAIDYDTDSSVVRLLITDPETGEAWGRTYSYLDAEGRVIRRVRHLGPKVDWSETYTYDEVGGEVVVEYTMYRNDSATTRRKKYRYEQYDDQGNWTKRTLFSWRDTGNGGEWVPSEVNYRTIEYRASDE